MKAKPDKTEVIQDETKVLLSILSFFSRARSRLDLCVSYLGPRTGEEFAAAIRAAKRRGVRIRLATEVATDNLDVMNAASRDLEVRHIPGLVGNSWAVSDDEYLSSLTVGEFRATFPLVYSNAESMVVEHQSIFDALWDGGEPLEVRRASLESGADLPEMEIIRDSGRAKRIYFSLVKEAKDQVLLIFPTPAAFLRDDSIGVIGLLEERASKGVKVRLLTPTDAEVLARLRKLSAVPSQRLSYRPVLEAEAKETVTVLVVDGTSSLTIDERDPIERDFDEAFGSAILTTRAPRVRQNARLFDRVWKETEAAEAARYAREREELDRKRAELMQDILTHDIRNFNQVARLNAELLGDQQAGAETTKRVSAILRAVDGSTRLIERAKKLGSIMAARDVALRPVSLGGSLKRSVSLVRRGNPTVRIRVEGTLSGEVLADELIDEVFVNIISNAVKYTDQSKVSVSLDQVPASLQGNPEGGERRAWKISVSDRGRGVPDSLKESVFRRYLETAKGSGLGLSIVHALVADRYGGKVELRDRVQGDFPKGTTVEIWLPRP